MAGEIAGEGRVAILFGRERWGLTNEEVALADRIVTFPVDPEFASLNLAQAVLLVGYEWFKCAKGGVLPYAATERSVRASKQQEQAFFDTLVAELDRVEFLRPPEKRDTMIVNLRNIFSRMEPTKQDMQTLHGAIKAIAEGSKGPARGGVLDSDEASRLARAARDHRRRPHAGRAGAGARARAAAQAEHVGRRAHAVEGADEGPPLRRPVQAPDAGGAADSGFRVVRPSRDDRTDRRGRARGGGERIAANAAHGWSSGNIGWWTCAKRMWRAIWTPCWRRWRRVFRRTRRR